MGLLRVAMGDIWMSGGSGGVFGRDLDWGLDFCDFICGSAFLQIK